MRATGIAARSAGYSLIGFAWPVALTLATTPYLLKMAGTLQYGVWALASTLFGVAGLIDLGVGIAATRSMAHNTAEGASEEARDSARICLETSIIFYVVAGLLAGGVIVVTASGLRNWLVPEVSGLALGWPNKAIMTMGFVFPTIMLANLASSSLSAFRDYRLVNAFAMARTTWNAISAVIVFRLGFGIVLAIALMGAGALVAALAGLIILRYRYLDFHFPPRFSRRHFRELFGQGSWTLIGQIAGLIRSSGDRVVLSTYRGASELSFYVVPQGIASRIHGVTASAMNVLFPLTAALSGAGKKEDERSLMEKCSVAAAVLAGSLAIPVASFAGPFLELWLSKTFAARATDVLSLLAASYLHFALGVVPYYGLNGRGKFWQTALFEVGAALATVVAAIALARPFGPIGICMGLFLGNFIQVPWIGFAYHRESRAFDCWWRIPVFAQGVFIITVAVGRYYIASHITNWPQLLLAGAGWAVMSGAILSLLLMGPRRWVGFVSRTRKTILQGGLS